MLLDKRDLDVLRLIGLCKDIPIDCSPIQSDMFSQTEFAVLSGAGYIQKSKCKRSYRLADKGFALLKQLGYPAEKDKHPVGAGGVLSRRLEVAKVILTVYRSPIPFLSEDEKQNVFIPSIKFRRNGGGEVLGASRMCGVFRYSDCITPAYFANIDTKFNPKVEIAAIRRLMTLYKINGNITFAFFTENQAVARLFKSPFEESSPVYPWGDGLCIIRKWPIHEQEPLPLEVSIYS